MNRCDRCNRVAWWRIVNREVDVPPAYACKGHLSQVCLESEYGEGDRLTVVRVFLD